MRTLWITALASLLFSTSEIWAQRREIKREIRWWRDGQKRHQPWSVAVRAGATQFWGELYQRNWDREWGVDIGYHFTTAEAFSIGFEVHKGSLSGQKKQFFNSRFKNHYTSTMILPRWDLLRGLTWDREQRWRMILYTGVGLSFFSAEAFDLDSGRRLRYTNDPVHSGRNALFKKYGLPVRKLGIRKTMERVVPLGFSPEYRISGGLTIGMDFRFIWVRTDKMDATSGLRTLNPEEADSYSDTPNDAYSSTLLYIRYRFLKSPG